MPFSLNLLQQYRTTKMMVDVDTRIDFSYLRVLDAIIVRAHMESFYESLDSSSTVEFLTSIDLQVYMST